jgi:hypothetical protein
MPNAAASFLTTIAHSVRSVEPKFAFQVLGLRRMTAKAMLGESRANPILKEIAILVLRPRDADAGHKRHRQAVKCHRSDTLIAANNVFQYSVPNSRGQIDILSFKHPARRESNFRNHCFGNSNRVPKEGATLTICYVQASSRSRAEGAWLAYFSNRFLCQSLRLLRGSSIHTAYGNRSMPGCPP